MKRLIVTIALIFIAFSGFAAEVKRFSSSGIEITGLENGTVKVFIWSIGTDDPSDTMKEETILYGNFATNKVTGGTWRMYPGSGRLAIVIVQNGVEELHVVEADF
jgi:hypothetical protein